MKRKIFRVLSLIVVVIFTTGILLTGILRNPYAQTYLARIVAIHLSEYLHTNVRIEKLRVSAFLNIEAERMEINDLQNKPLIHFKKLYVSSNLFKLFDQAIDLNKMEIDSANVFMRHYKGKDKFNITNLLNRLFGNYSFAPDSVRMDKKPFLLKIDQVDIKNSRFVYQIEDEIKSPGFGIDLYDLDIQNIDASLKDVFMLKDSIHLLLEHICVTEKSGFQLNHLEGDLTLFGSGMQFNATLLETPYSKMEFNLNFSYPNWQAYTHFVDDINLEAEIFAGRLNTIDFSFFAPDLQKMNNPFRLSGKFNGPIRNLRARNIVLSYGNETEFEGNIQMTGLPKIYETFISLKVKNFSTSVNDIQKLNMSGGYRLNKLPDLLFTFGTIKVKGNFTGFYNDFVSNASFNTKIGGLTTDIQFSNNPNRNIIEYRGDFQARKFNLGQFLKNTEYFGKLDFDLKVKGEGLDLENLYANVEGGINNFEYKGKKLEDIAIKGLFQERQFTGDISINDKLIKADFQGHIKFDSLVPIFDFNLKLDHTHLALLGILPIDSSAVVSSNINLNFSGNTLDNIRGEIRLDTTQLFYKNELYSMNAFRVKTTSAWNADRSIRLSSDFVDGEISGDFLLSELKSTAQYFMHKYVPNLISTNESGINSYSKNIYWDFRFKELSEILPLFHKPLQISNNSQWVGSFDTDKNKLKSLLSLQNASYKGLKFNNLQLKIYNSNDALNTDLAIESLIFKEETENDTLQLGVDNLRFSSIAKEDSILFLINWKNKFKTIKNKGDIAGILNLSNDSIVDLKFSKADLIINDSTWNIYPQNHLILKKNQLIFEKMGFYSGSQQVELTGSLDEKSEQAFNIDFNNFDISNFDILTNYRGLDLDGLIEGDMQFIRTKKNLDFLANLQVKNLKINKEIIGDINLKSKRNLDKSIFLNAEIVKILENKDIQKTLVFEGLYFPDRDENALDFSLFINHLPAQVVSPLLYQWVENLEGSASGNVFIKGSLEKPDVSGNIKLEKLGFRIIYLNTSYILTANAVIDNSFIDLRDAELRDERNNPALVYGGLYHNHLKDFTLDISLWPQNFMGLNTHKGMNSLYYGKAFVSGSVDISGHFNEAVELDMNLVANRGSDIVIPINLTADVSNNEFITFISYQDTSLKKFEKKQIRELSGFSLNMDLSLTPNAKVEIILPGDLGNIQGIGTGDLNLNLNRAGDFTMAGDYRINKGTFLFTIKNVYKKRFDLVDGGTIAWGGDPYAGELNMKAIYHVRASLNTLGSEQDTTFRSRVPIDCVIKLNDLILNPTVKFGFEFPNSPEEVRQLVFSQIDTTNEAEMSQQMLSLLVLNSFSFSSATGNYDLASNVSGSSLQLVASQLGNWLSQINNNLDVGINYRPGGAITNEEVEVALSTQLFNERITVDGNFGYQNINNISNSNTSNIVGDINVEVKITKDGRFRLKAFNRTNTADLFDNIAPYTQGVGVFYRKEFNFFKDLFLRKKEEEKIDEDSEKLNDNSGSPAESSFKVRRPMPPKLIPSK